MGMGFVPTWLRQVSPPASQNHFNHCMCHNNAALSCCLFLTVLSDVLVVWKIENIIC